MPRFSVKTTPALRITRNMTSRWHDYYQPLASLALLPAPRITHTNTITTTSITSTIRSSKKYHSVRSIYFSSYQLGASTVSPVTQSKAQGASDSEASEQALQKASEASEQALQKALGLEPCEQAV